jgi:hypothetical protein
MELAALSVKATDMVAVVAAESKRKKEKGGFM